MIQLQYVDLTKEELRQLGKMLALTIFHTKADVYMRTRKGDLTIWAYRENGADVKLILEVLEYGNGRALNVFGVFGKGLMRNIEPIRAWLEHYKHKYGCKWIIAYAARGGAERLHVKIGAKPIATLSIYT